MDYVRNHNTLQNRVVPNVLYFKHHFSDLLLNLLRFSRLKNHALHISQSDTLRKTQVYA